MKPLGEIENDTLLTAMLNIMTPWDIFELLPEEAQEDVKLEIEEMEGKNK